jgi:beta-N-acetylhexosaminidase
VIATGLIACSAPASKSPQTTATVATTPVPTSTTSTAADSPSTTTSVCTEAAAVATWPLARRAAQLVVIPALNGQLRQLGSPISAGVGGVVLLGSSTPTDLAAQVSMANRLAPTPLMVMADEEGGGVQRLAGLVESLPWARQMAATWTPAQVQAAAARIAGQMAALGVTVDLAPVLDVDGGDGPNARNPDGLRSFSADPATVVRYGSAFVDGLLQGGVTPVVKHFPGLGGATANTDYGPADTRPVADLRATGLVPFRAAVAAGAPAVMISNAAVPGLTTLPASISPAAVQTLLRSELGFHGLVLTDSLSAGSVTAAGYGIVRAAVAAVEAGADMVLFGSTLTPAEAVLLSPENVAASTSQIISAISQAVISGELPSSRIDQAVLDVLNAKRVHLCK